MPTERLGNYERQQEELWSKLTSWGVETTHFIDPDSQRLNLDTYCQFLYQTFRHPRGLGELQVPDQLVSSFTTDTKVGVFSAPMGFGHHRLSRYYQILLQTLNVNAQHIDIGQQKDALPALAKLLSHIKTAYINGSNKTASDLGLSQYQDWLSYNEQNLLVNALKLWERHAPDHFYNTMMGKPGKHLKPENTRRTFQLLDTVFGKQLRRYLKGQGITHHLVLYPMINGLLSKKNTVLIGTDSVLEPAGWIPDPLLIVETQFARGRLLKAWKGKFQGNIHVSQGFPAPISGLVQQTFLMDQRAERLNREPLVLFLPASGVATTQLGSFSDILVEAAPQIQAGQLRLIIQTGAEFLGQQVYTHLTDLLHQLRNEYPCLADNVLLHYGPTTESALDLFEILASSSLPLTMAVKGSEMSRIAVQLGIPHIATGTIGEHEKWNCIVSALQNAPIFILPSAFIECWKLVDSPHFPTNWKGQAFAALENHYCDSVTQALNLSRQAIHCRQQADVNRQMMIDTLRLLIKNGR